MNIWHRLVDFFELHFPVLVLVVMFFGGAFLLAHYQLYEEMSRWIEGGPTVVALVAILRIAAGLPERDTPTSPINTKSEETK